MLAAFPRSSDRRLSEALERTILTRIQTARSKGHLLLVTTDGKVGNAYAEPKSTTGRSGTLVIEMRSAV